MTLLETLALLTFILALLSLIVDVIHLTFEVMEKFPPITGLYMRAP